MTRVFLSLSLRVRVHSGRTHNVRTGCDGGRHNGLDRVMPWCISGAKSDELYEVVSQLVCYLSIRVQTIHSVQTRISPKVIKI